MVVGSAIVAICLLVLGFTRELTEIFSSNDNTIKGLTTGLAVLAIYMLNFAVNMGMSARFERVKLAVNQGPNPNSPVTSCSKSLIIDTLTAEQQQTGVGWGK